MCPCSAPCVPVVYNVSLWGTTCTYMCPCGVQCVSVGYYMYIYVSLWGTTCTVPVIKKLKYRTEAVPKQYRSSTEAVPKQYRINTERRANLDSNVYMYAGAVRCGTVRCARCGARARYARYSASRRGAIRY